ncbi:MAG: hypothetical protein HKN10_09380, partial [Myxococcales bacterium]|nr:hypothetical protein [Myxococcales bacterium]
LWWAHERLHRACLASYHERRVTFADDRERFQDECLQPSADPDQMWRDHRTYIDHWRDAASKVKAARVPLPMRRFWSKQARVTSMPA